MDHASFLRETRDRSADLADYAEEVAASPLRFEGEYPLMHSSDNHVHLWKLEYLADDLTWIDTRFRTQFVRYVLEQWRRRAKGLEPYRDRGYRLFVYEDLAPTLSMVAETPTGFPYSRQGMHQVETIEEVMGVYEGRSWRALFESEEGGIKPDRVIELIRQHAGSLGSGPASRLGVNVAQLRRLIVNFGLEDEVNQIRKHFRRRPADLKPLPDEGPPWRLWERRLPAGYD